MKMKSRFLATLVAAPFLLATVLPAQEATPTGKKLMPSHVMNVTAAETSSTPAHRRHVRRRTKKKSAMIVGGAGLAGAGIGALAGGKKGAVIGGVAGAGTGYVYDRKTQKKPIIPK